MSIDRNEEVNPWVLKALKAALAAHSEKLEKALAWITTGEMQSPRRNQLLEFLGKLTDELNDALSMQHGLEVETYAQDNRAVDPLLWAEDWDPRTGKVTREYFDTLSAAARSLGVTVPTISWHRRAVRERMREKGLDPERHAITEVNGRVLRFSPRCLTERRLPRNPRPAGA